jgi:AGZA family xanthine/uracil permease-like MFS transporter
MYAYGPALIVVGYLMLGVLQHIDFSDFTELVPAFVTITLMSFTYNLGIGITAGFIVYPMMKLGGRQEPRSASWDVGFMRALTAILPDVSVSMKPQPHD